jgi:HD-like signal output (HDOD) protein
MNEPVVKKNIIRKLILAQPVTIPIFHDVALRLLQMMNDHSYRIEEAIKLVNEDTALAAEMLKHANSTYNSGKDPITTIKNAIVRLGSQQVVNLAFTASMANSASENPVINTYLKNIWYHSHTVAITSAWLAVQISHDDKNSDINPDEVYLAGLFHDIGKLYLLKSIEGLIRSEILQIHDDLIDEIIEEFCIQQGIRVLKQWHIPEIYIHSVERHETKNWKCGTNDQLVASVRLSCKLHSYMKQGIATTPASEAFEFVKDELAALKIYDVSYVCDMIEAISD